MTDTYKILGQTLTGQKAKNNVDIKESVLYTVPNNKNAALSSITVTNSSDLSKDYTLSVLKSGEDIASTESLYFDNMFYNISDSNKSIKYSLDGITWTVKSLNIPYIPMQIISGGDYVVIAGNNKFSYTTDMKNWTTKNTNLQYPSAISYGNNKFVIAGSPSKALVIDNFNFNSATEHAMIFTASAMLFNDGRFVASQTGGVAYSTDGSNWFSNSYPASQTYQIAYGNNIYIAAGWYDILISSDGVTWRKSAFQEAASGITFIDNSFYLYGHGIWRSQDGVNWSKVQNFANFNIQTLRKSSNLFLAYDSDGYSSRFSYSYDGVNWVLVENASYVKSIDYVNGILFYVRGQNGSGIHYSVDMGQSWSTTLSGQSFFTTSPRSSENVPDVRGFAFSGNGYATTTDGTSWTYENSPVSGQYAATGNGLTLILQPWNYTLYVTSDGSTWTAVSTEMNYINRLKFMNNVFTARYGDSILFSTDGFNWTRVFPGLSTGNPTDAVYNQQKLVVINQSSYAVYDTTNYSWTRSWDRPDTSTIAYSNGSYYFIGYNTDSKLSFINGMPAYSRKNHNLGINATSAISVNNKIIVGGPHQATVYDIATDSYTRTYSNSNFVNVAYGNGKYVAVTSENAYYLSDDGISWTRYAFERHLNGVAFGNNKFVFTGQSNYIYMTEDFITFNSAYVTNSTEDVIYDGSKFVAVGWWQGTSTDGLNWSQAQVNQYISRIKSGNGIFMGYGNGQIQRSADGLSWQNVNTPSYPYSIGYINGTWVLLNWQGAYISSDNGDTWTAVASSVYFGAQDTFTFNNKLYCIGYGGIKSTTDGVTWTQGANITLFRALVNQNEIVFCVGSSTIVTEDLVNFVERVPVYIGQNGLAYKDGVLIAKGTNRVYQNVLAKSENGLDWTILESGLSGPTGTTSLFAVENLPTSLNKQNIVYKKEIKPGTVHEFKGGITLSSGDKIRVYSDSDEIIVNAYGVEIG